MEELLARFVERDRLPGQQIQKKLLEIDFTQVDEPTAVIALADLLLEEKSPDAGIFDFPPGTPFNDRLIGYTSKKQKISRRAFLNWFFVSTGYSRYVLYLFNVNYGETRAILKALRKFEDKKPPPYLFRVLQNITLAYFPQEQLAPLIADQEDLTLWAPLLNEMFATMEPVEHWLNTKDNTLRFYGGQTNTILGMYDGLCTKRTGFDRLPRNADFYCDLGGGFNTPEMVRLAKGLPFISHDIIPPSQSKKIVLVKKTSTGEILLNEDDRQVYLGKLLTTPYQEFDVFKDQFPQDKNSYVIVSTGFLTSTVRAPTLGYAGHGFYATSLAGISKIVALIQAGKSVDLFTINRATSRVYSNKTVYMSFRRGRLVDLVISPESLNRYTFERRQKYLEMIDPQTSPFQEFLGRKDPKWKFELHISSL